MKCDKFMITVITTTFLVEATFPQKFANTVREFVPGLVPKYSLLFTVLIECEEKREEGGRGGGGFKERGGGA